MHYKYTENTERLWLAPLTERTRDAQKVRSTPILIGRNLALLIFACLFAKANVLN